MGRTWVCSNTHNEGPELPRTIRDFYSKRGDDDVDFVIVADGTVDGSDVEADQLNRYQGAAWPGANVTVLKPVERIGIGGAKVLQVEKALDLGAKADPQNVIFHTDAHARIVAGSIGEMAAIARENSPCIVTPAVGPLNCAKARKCPHWKDPKICQVDCPDIEDALTIPSNCYYGGDIGFENEGDPLGLSAKYTLKRPKDIVSRTLAVNPSLFCYTVETLELLGGWNKYPGWWGSQELGLTLRAWFADIPVLIARDQVFLHRYRSWNQEGAFAPYQIPSGHRGVNWRYAHAMVFDPETYNNVWAPWFRRWHDDPAADAALDASDIAEAGAHFRKGKKRTDREFFADVLKRPFPLDQSCRPEATRGLYCLKAGLGNVLLAVPAIKALAELSGEPVDIWDRGFHQAGAAALLELQPFVRKVLRTEPALQWYKYIVGSYWADGPAFVPEGAKASEAPRAWRTQHEAETNFAAVEKLGFSGPMPSGELISWQIPGNAPASGYVAVGVGCAGFDSKKYPHWEDVCNILSEAGARLVFVGAAGDDAPWMDAIPEGVNLCGKTTIPEAAGILGGARLYLGIDNGLSHLAAAMRTPAVLLYGPSSERKNAPWTTAATILRSDKFDCGPCWDGSNQKKCKNAANGCRPCMDDLSPRWVAGKALDAMNGPAWTAGKTWPLYLSRKQSIENKGAHFLQNHTEFVELLDLIRGFQIRNVVEIGSADGAWLGAVAGVLGGRLNLLSIDPDPNTFPNPHKAPADHARHFGAVRESLIAAGHSCAHIAKMSDDAVDDARAWINAHGPVDLLHIDGDHSLQQAWADWENYKPMVRPGGLVVFHDVNNLDAAGPDLIFESLRRKTDYQTWRFTYGKLRPHGRGIGVLRMPPERGF